jgi:hypothetical protein
MGCSRSVIAEFTVLRISHGSTLLYGNKPRSSYDQIWYAWQCYRNINLHSPTKEYLIVSINIINTTDSVYGPL